MRALKKEYLLLTLFRSITITVVVGVGIYFLRGYGELLRPLLGLVLLTYLTSYVFWISFKSGINLKFLIYVQLILDIFIQTALIHYTGGILSEFTFLYFFTIMQASLFLLLKGAVLTATLASIAYSALLILERNGRIIPILDYSTAVTREGGFFLLKLYIHVLFFYLVAFLTSYVSEQLVKSGRELEITKRVLKQVKLDTSAILENIPSGLVALDMWGNILYFNRAAKKILGFSGRPHLMDMMEEAPEFAAELTNILLGQEKQKRREIEVKTADGKEKPIGFNHAYLYDESGAKRGAIVVFQDLTEVKELEWEVRKLDRLAAIGEFSAHLAHEIRNPLTSIRGSIELLKEVNLDGDARKLMELIIKESDRLNRIVTDFLEFAKLPPPKKEEIDLVATLNRILDLVSRSVSIDKKVRFIKEFDDTPLRLHADESQLEEVFLNLISNAVDAVQTEGEIYIRVVPPGAEVTRLNGDISRVPEDRVVVQIRDTGVGIDEAQVKKIFEPFFTTKAEGVGLGLSIVQRIIGNHGGEIKVESVKNRGTIFTIYLPRENSENG